VVPPEPINTLDGAFTAVLLLASDTVSPPVGAAELSTTVHAVDPAPVNEVEPHDNAVMMGVPLDVTVALREIETDFVTLPCFAVMVPV
jgi:hypothetical protein